MVKMVLLEFISGVLSKQQSIGLPGRYVRHLITGGIGTLLYIGLIFAFVELWSWHPVTGATFAYLIMEIYIYIVYRLWVYQTEKGHHYSLPRYIVTSAVALILNCGVMYMTVEVFHLSYFWGVLIGASIIPVSNFSMNYYWAFK